MALIPKDKPPGLYNAGNRSPVVVVRNRIQQPDLTPGLRYSNAPTPLNNPTHTPLGQQLDISRSPDFWMERISKNVDIGITLQTLRLGFISNTINIGTTQTLVIPRAKYPRAYALFNPPAITTIFAAGTFTFFASAARTPAGNPHNSTVATVITAETVRLWLDITANVGGSTLNINAQTQDPLSGNFANSQLDVFSGASAIGTYYANLGQSGVDQLLRLQGTVTGTSITFSISGLLKGATGLAGEIVFIGSRDVNVTSGFPIIANNEPTKLFLTDNTELWGVANLAKDLRVFQLQ